MTADYHKNDVSLNEALALLLHGPNGLWQFRREEVDILEELERNLACCALDLEEAKAAQQDKKAEQYQIEAAEAAAEFDRAGELYTRLCGEVAKIRNGKQSAIEITRDDPDKHGYDLVLISRQSLLDFPVEDSTPQTQEANCSPQQPGPAGHHLYFFARA